MSVLALGAEHRKHSDRLSELLDKVDYRIAATDEDKEAIFKLRYEAYSRENFIPPNFSRRLSDKYDELDNTTIFALFIEGQLATTIRVSIGSSHYPDFPAMDVFGDVLTPLLAAGKVIVDPTRHANNEALSRAYPGLLPFMTTRVPWLVAGYFNADLILAAVRPEHQAFYRRVFGCEVRGNPGYYPGLNRPHVLMTCDFHAMKEDVEQRYPTFRSSNFERRMLYERPLPMLPPQMPLPVLARTATGIAGAIAS